MKIVLFGATGSIGQAIAAELSGRGHRVTGVSRTAGGPAGDLASARRGDAADPDSVARLAAGHDAVVSAVAAGDPASLADAASGLVRGLRRAGVRRLLAVGGAGTLETEPGVRLVDTPGFPEPYKPASYAQAAALAVFRTVEDLDWTYLSPAIVIKPGERTGRYRLGGDRVLTDSAGASAISIPDFALALADELERRTAIRRRITVAY
ncbi:NAD(P)H-binding protein [Actinomadura sp. LD22]|uniref:NAD(P)H-binding protein n=1 Tax=Actinomadura physcomitrii TaxID=2650748 RepID=A0A6I4MT00_9ACTN|nr:NAD(P)H-binding protein [Actinomadura physcomitrii]MWA05426.1 NAD(P)H-binding protein [Actinomadura physcomitrii]